jgi:hypothetical protein
MQRSGDVCWHGTEFTKAPSYEGDDLPTQLTLDDALQS